MALVLAGATAHTAPPSPPSPPSFVEFEAARSPAGAVAGRNATCSRSTSPTAGSDLHRRARGLTLAGESRSAWSRSRRRAQQRRGLGLNTCPIASASSTSRRSTSCAPLLVGDEPRDIVFRRHRPRACLHHHRAPRQQRTDPSIGGRARRRRFRSSPPRHRPRRRLVFDKREPRHDRSAARRCRSSRLFGDTPRALASRPTATRLRRIFHSGNTTTAIPSEAVCKGVGSTTPCTVDGATLPAAVQAPATDAAADAAPQVSLIVRQTSRRASGSTSSAATGAARCGSRSPTRTCSRSTRTASRPPRDRARRHHLCSTSRSTGRRHALRLEPGRTETRPASRARHVRRPLAARPPRRDADHVVTPTQVLPRHLNKHIVYSSASAPAGTAEHSLRFHWTCGHHRRRHAVRRRLRLEQDRRVLDRRVAADSFDPRPRARATSGHRRRSGPA